MSAGAEGIPVETLVRPALRQVSPYLPGKPIAEVQREFGLSRVVKLASNENPLGMSPKALKAASRALRGAFRYPEGSSPLLRKALAAFLGIAPSRVLVGNGSDEIIRLLCDAFVRPEDEVVVSRYGFIRFRQCAAVMGAKVVEVPAKGYGHDLKAMARAAGPRTKLLFIANPNNPTGTYAAKEELSALMGSVPSGVLVVLDEAYWDYARESSGYPDSLPGWALKYPNLAVLRTFSKVYGMAGLRVGYAVASAEVVAFLDRIRIPFNVGVVAQEAALAALEDRSFVRRSTALIRREKPALAEKLGKMGLAVQDSAANFLLTDVSPLTGAEVFKSLLKEGVIVRPLDEYGLASHLRISVGNRWENKRLCDALKRVIRA